MSSGVTKALNLWRRAEQDSREVEALFESAFADYLHHGGPEVSREMVRLVTHSRQRANALLSDALSLLKAQAN